ncbi:endonuclease III domain-containing protein [Desulfonatronum sp. SC1]|uniref:endonuclease III domain-containing protein n=1 Tax=Desulfonatronum sp. SC1 TaxID=2109626 RepID=UPI000D324112|nr:endonuclease III domain-containing protein [Desulfonatronum sp. SC1]PTN37561.1 endonuclease [Desulfonatronum sp. SC1]
MPTATTRLLSDMFDAMLVQLGPSGWWPANSPFEVIVGAILTQNTNWSNVEKAIANLRRHDLLDPERLRQARPEIVEACIRPSGFFRQKAKKIQNFLAFLHQEHATGMMDLAHLGTAELRERLLEIKGIGPETADSILLYALDRPVFVVDAYTARICNRHGLVPEDVAYDELQDLFVSHLPERVEQYNEYHALLVRVGKEWCRKREPRCAGCPLQPFLPRHSPPARTP